MHLTRENLLEIAAICLLAAGSALSFLVAYARWGDLPYITLFLVEFRRWPWVRVSLMLTMITSLAARAGVLRSTKVGILDSAVTYAVVVVPIAILLLYPGLDRLGVSSDPRVFTLLFLTVVVHGLGFWFLRNLFRRGRARLTASDGGLE